MNNFRPTDFPIPKVLLENLEEVSYPKNYFLYREGKVCTKIWLLKKGAVGYFFQGKDKEHLAWIDVADDWVASIGSVMAGNPARESAMLLEDSELFELDFTQIEQHFTNPLELEKYKNAIMLHYFMGLEDRLKTFMSLDAKDRYQYLLDNKPQLIQQVSLQQLASFLGITPETLSRIRAAIS